MILIPRLVYLIKTDKTKIYYDKNISLINLKYLISYIKFKTVVIAKLNIKNKV